MIELRPAGRADLPAMTTVARAFDTTWFGAPENDLDEIEERLALARAACLVTVAGRPVGVGLIHRTGSEVLVDPGGDPAAYAALVAWLADQQAPGTEALDRDERFRSALAAAGWVHSRSSFDLLRSVEPEWARPAPRWPEGVAVCGFAPDDAEALHHLIYVDAGWTDVAGHHPRDFAEWQQIFLTGGDDPAPVLAVDGGRLVGGALLRVFSDGAGWVGQLAVARDQRGRGLGRALLLESLQRLQAAGATKLGLSVIATNRTALQLYLGVGLRIDREWQTFVPPEGPAPRDQ